MSSTDQPIIIGVSTVSSEGDKVVLEPLSLTDFKNSTEYKNLGTAQRKVLDVVMNDYAGKRADGSQIEADRVRVILESSRTVAEDDESKTTIAPAKLHLGELDASGKEVKVSTSYDITKNKLSLLDDPITLELNKHGKPSRDDVDGFLGQIVEKTYKGELAIAMKNGHSGNIQYGDGGVSSPLTAINPEVLAAAKRSIA
jgi:hypothetical protein